ncbi:hypothetical protein BBD42_14840 [Paenibacillus sp. BIHB 4019]|uniref:Uncharacterized protein n=1 Tax=Paenibacillus sp. BIHB 4019 TaxID=1870819 RepID=A0A1B2DIT6_9BACL|nr:hypothetical protein [Paenibacillus sp. BIHB 4019]ANY67611.1 hypothetical protein BBD42_14840 [Paenibacillus sp. BIHB 4019]
MRKGYDSSKMISYANGIVWLVIGAFFIKNGISTPNREELMFYILLYSLIFVFPAWIGVYLGLRYSNRKSVQKKHKEAIDSLELELHIARQELLHEKSLAENEEQARKSAREAEEQAAAAARLVEQTEHHNARQGPPPPPAPPSMPKTISCPGCGASKLLRPMQSEECDYCGRMLVYR